MPFTLLKSLEKYAASLNPRSNAMKTQGSFSNVSIHMKNHNAGLNIPGLWEKLLKEGKKFPTP